MLPRHQGLDCLRRTEYFQPIEMHGGDIGREPTVDAEVGILDISTRDMIHYHISITSVETLGLTPSICMLLRLLVNAEFGISMYSRLIP